MSHQEILTFFSKYIENESGIIYAEHNYYQLQNRLNEIAELMGLDSLENLYDQAKVGITGSFRQLLLDIATNNETSFFRDPKVFEAIEKLVLNRATSFLSSNEKMRIWSAASSTGQEALSTAILLREYSDKNRIEIPVSILGTDISERALDQARRACYTQLEVQRGLSASYLSKYFRKSDDEKWVASSELRQLIQFKQLNLKSPFTFSEKFHLILCRNVLIYQNAKAKADILQQLASNLTPGGCLVVGAGESVLNLLRGFEQESSGGAVIYRKNSRTHQKSR